MLVARPKRRSLLFKYGVRPLEREGLVLDAPTLNVARGKEVFPRGELVLFGVPTVSEKKGECRRFTN